MAVALVFSTAGFDREVIRLADGRLAERSRNRAGKWGWLVYGQTGAREAFYTDAEWARKAAR